MSYAVQGLNRIRWGFIACAAITLAGFCALALQASAPTLSGAPEGSGVPVTPKLERLAKSSPKTGVEVIVQLERSTSPATGRALVRSLGGRPTGEVQIIRALAAKMSAGAAYALAKRDGVRAVSLNAKVENTGRVANIASGAIDSALIATSYNDSVESPKAWSGNPSVTGKGIGVAVIDTGIAGNLADFRTSQSDTSSRVSVSAVTNPYATSAGDSYGHGTHVAGIIASNATNRALTDPLYGRYVGVAPDANLISIKASDEQGNSTVLDVIYGLQFALDYKDAYNIRVVNLSLESTQAESYRTDPLDAAAEAAWFGGIVVVAAAGNRGSAQDAVSYAPGNDPYVISVGAVDDQGTKNASDDLVASWSSQGTTQDGHQKPEILAPGSRIVSNLAPGSAFAQLCASCITDGQYIRAGGTSMSAPMVTGAVALALESHPEWTPDQVKGAIIANGRYVGSSTVNAISAFGISKQNPSIAQANQGLTPSTLIDPATGQIDYTRSRWSRSRWSTAASGLRSSWSRSSWSCNCSRTATGSIDPTRSSWSRSSWSSTTDWNK